MTPEEAMQAASDGTVDAVEGIDPATAFERAGRFSVSGLVVIPIGAVSPSLRESDDIALHDENGAAFGTLCFTKRLPSAAPGTLTRWQYAAYLADVEIGQLGQAHDFQSDYVVVDVGFADEYEANYAAGAPLWGGFSHDPPPSRLSAPSVTSIIAMPAVVIPTSNHKQSLNRYVESTNAFDRFLKLYHTLELLFDFTIMKQMQKMGDDLAGFGRVISSYNSKETDRLKYVLGTLCDEPERIASALGKVSLHKARAEEIFQNFAKGDNPLSDEAWVKFTDLAAAGQLTEVDVKGAKELGSARAQYNKLVFSIATYWIYRVRSSIAHSKVGEFLFVESDEAFIADFAEPLLLEVVRQVFSGPGLKGIVV